MLPLRFQLIPAATLALLVVVPTAVQAASPASATWKTYRNSRAGFAVKYPQAWTAHARWSSSATLDVAFLPPNRNTGVTAVSRPPFPRTVTEPGNTPNMRCHDVKVHGVTGTYCVNTASDAAITTFQIAKKAFTLSASLRQVKTSVYDHIVRSFRLIG
jgi:hypothetical protein